MTPRASAAARTEPPRVAPRDPRTAPRRQPTIATRPSVASPGPAPATRRRRRPRPVAIAVGLVVAGLLAVVGGNMQLAAGQLRLEQIQSRLDQVQAAYAAELAAVAAETSPQELAKIAGLQAEPRQVLPIYSVSLQHRLPAPTLSAARCCS